MYDANPQPPIRVLLADSHKSIADAFSYVFQNVYNMVVVATTENTQETREAIEFHKPQLVLLSVDLPGSSPFALVADLSKEMPEINTAFLADRGADVLVDQAIRAGATGFLLKSDPILELVQHCRRIACGGTSFSTEIKEKLEQKEGSRHYRLDSKSTLSALTKRQLEVLRRLAEGDSVKKIANDLHISSKSVDSHKYRLMQRLGIHDRVELCRLAIREGLIHA
ncbi:Response regulator UvrY [Polystyrenella longa]|uniref:Response regulator UvrY n=1 Tax=Polystyrenella longa TaxID=2528007 RepID=A0A518CUA2_9PLAN|nr:response regulator transcription factor [Polystyrenella longa]QDU82774.1 Response regulator UvrY [Polystyrenella longa]